MTPDPKGYYARLGVEPTADGAAIGAAFRRKARLLHPDVPATGDAEAFIRVKQAYDVLADPVRRAAYEREARRPADASAPPASARPASARSATDHHFSAAMASPRATAAPPIRSRFSGVPLPVWLVLIATLVVATTEAVMRLSGPSAPPNAPAALLSRGAPNGSNRPAGALHASGLSAPIRLLGPPTHYVAPGMGSVVIWQRDPSDARLVPAGRIAPFASVHAIGPIPEQGLLAIALAGGMVGYVEAPRLLAGSRADAKRARCAYDAGPPPVSGELLARSEPGTDRLTIKNHATAAAVVKLRNLAGGTAASVYIAPDAFTIVTDLPAGPWRADVAFGTLWSRACGRFAAGQQAKRLVAPVRPGGVLDLSPVAGNWAEPGDISDETFARD